MMRASSCWRCRALFEEDAAFQLRVFGALREAGPEAAREMVDEHYADEHAEHEGSWGVMRPGNAAPASDEAGRLLVECWCGAAFVWVWPRDVRAGRTGVCGGRECHAPESGAA